MDRQSIDCVRPYLSGEQGPEVGALLLIETDGPPDQARAEAETATRICLENGALSARQAKSREESENMWRARRALGPAMNLMASGKFNEDIVVPRSRIPEMIERQEEISKKHDTRIVSFGHAGDGNIHINVMYDRDVPEETERAPSGRARPFYRLSRTWRHHFRRTRDRHHQETFHRHGNQHRIPEPATPHQNRFRPPDGIMNPGKIFLP